jgi:hypothetical protein
MERALAATRKRQAHRLASGPNVSDLRMALRNRFRMNSKSKT